MPFGAGAVSLDLDAELVEPAHAEPPADEKAAIRRALDNPIGTPPLGEIVRPGESVAVIVNDVTRRVRSDLFLPVLIDTLNRAGVPDRDIFIVFALGTHRRQTREEQRGIVGEEIFRRIRLYDHDGADDANLVAVGTTRFGNRVEINRRVYEADRIVLTGEIIEHRIAGYSGGRKSLVPGVAGNRTTAFNHRMVLDPRCRAAVLDGNPAHEDLLDSCALVGPDFLLNVILSTDGRLLHAVAGHYDEAHRAGCRAAARLLGTAIGPPFDLLVASSGGSPLDIDLRQAHKGMENACGALRKGGSLFYYAECGDGLGSGMLEDYLRRFASAAAMEEALRSDFVVGGHKALWLARLGECYDVYLVTRLDPFFVRRCGFRPVAPEEHRTRLGDLIRSQQPDRVGVMPNASFTVPVCGS